VALLAVVSVMVLVVQAVFIRQVVQRHRALAVQEFQQVEVLVQQLVLLHKMQQAEQVVAV
jgi:hypothetical protein